MQVFAASTEDAVLTWNYVPVLLGYKYNLSVMLPEILDMLEACTATPEGEHIVQFGSDSFLVDWRLRWSGGQLALHGSWSCIRGNYQALLNERPDISLPLDEFTAEWKAVLERIVGAIDASGIQLEAGDERLDRLRALIARLPPRYGKRYRDGRPSPA
jgi:hypothetical protein